MFPSLSKRAVTVTKTFLAIQSKTKPFGNCFSFNSMAKWGLIIPAVSIRKKTDEYRICIYR